MDGRKSGALARDEGDELIVDQLYSLNGKPNIFQRVIMMVRCFREAGGFNVILYTEDSDTVQIPSHKHINLCINICLTCYAFHCSC